MHLVENGIDEMLTRTGALTGHENGLSLGDIGGCEEERRRSTSSESSLGSHDWPSSNLGRKEKNQDDWLLHIEKEGIPWEDEDH